ncbi:hypothetical protein [Enterococcus faecalis]|uniref:hypothetical protein n=1 Tax=Enterococcus faecalis TaxID=1351 RepID=UPI0039A49529
MDKISKNLFIDAALVENVENYIQEYNYPQKSFSVIVEKALDDFFNNKESTEKSLLRKLNGISKDIKVLQFMLIRAADKLDLGYTQRYYGVLENDYLMKQSLEDYDLFINSQKTRKKEIDRKIERIETVKKEPEIIEKESTRYSDWSRPSIYD